MIVDAINICLVVVGMFILFPAMAQEDNEIKKLKKDPNYDTKIGAGKQIGWLLIGLGFFIAFIRFFALKQYQ